MTEKADMTLSASVEVAVKKYLANMEGYEVRNLYDLVISEVEASLLSCVMQHTGNNQSRTAVVLGLNRGTLRDRLKKYRLM